MFKVQWTDDAKFDLQKSLSYYLRVAGIDTARSIHGRIKSQVSSLKNFPERTREGVVAGTREFVISRLPFIAVIRIESSTVFVVNLIHTAKKYPPDDEI